MEEKKNLNEELDKKINDIKLEYKNELFNIIKNINNFYNFKELNNKNYNEIKEEFKLLKTMIMSIFTKNIEKEQDKIIISLIIDISQKLMIENKELKEEIKINKNNIKCNFCEKNELQLKKYEKENTEYHSVINDLRNQLYNLKLNYKLKKDNKIIKKKKFKVEKNDLLPNIDQYFISNDKYMLIDSDKNLWHMYKCYKFYKYKEKNEGKYNSSDDLIKDFVDEYEKVIENKNEEEEKIWKDFDEIINSDNSINEKEKDNDKYKDKDKENEKDKYKDIENEIDKDKENKKEKEKDSNNNNEEEKDGNININYDWTLI